MKILVTGATGFVGGHLCRQLTSHGHKVYALARDQDKAIRQGVCGRILLGDLSKNWDWVHHLPEDLEAAIHTAGIVHSYTPNEFYDVNEKGTKELLIKLRSRYAKLHFIHLSSLAAAGPCKGPSRTEEDLAMPVNHYGKSKLLGEKLVTYLCPPLWTYQIIRPPIVMGPGDPAFLEVFSQVNRGLFLLPGREGAKHRYSFIAVYDLAEGIIKSLECPDNQLFYLAHPQTIDHRSLLLAIKKGLGAKKHREITVPSWALKTAAKALKTMYRFTHHRQRLTPDKAHEILNADWVCSPQKSIKRLQMNYQWDLEHTIRETISDYRMRKWIP